MSHFSVFTAPYYSFFSRALFVDVGRRWGAKTFGYLVLVLALMWIPFMLGVRSQWSDFLNDEVPALTQQIPPITIDNGLVIADVEQPHFIRIPENEVFAIIDTTGHFTSLEGTSAKLLLTDTRFFGKKSDTETRILDLSAVQNFYLDGPLVEKWMRLLGTWGVVLLYPVLVIGSFLFRIVQALFYSLFGLVIAKRLHCRLSYGSILRIAVVAITPAVVLKTLLEMAGLSSRFLWLIYFCIAIGYLAFGIASNADNPHSEGNVVPG